MANTNTEDFYYGTDYARESLASVTEKKRTKYGLSFPIGKDNPYLVLFFSVTKAKLSVTEKKRTKYGLSFPIGKKPGNGGYFQKASGINLIRMNLSQLFRTELGERVMLPNFGLSLRKYLFSNMDEYLFNEIRKDVLTSLSQYARDVIPRKLSIYQHGETTPQGGSGLTVKLLLQTKNTDQLFSVDVEVV